MGYNQKNQIWDPSSGIRFSPGPDSRSSHPSADVPRSIHGLTSSTGPGGGAVWTSKEPQSVPVPVPVPVDSRTFAGISDGQDMATVLPIESNEPTASQDTSRELLEEDFIDKDLSDEDIAAAIEGVSGEPQPKEIEYIDPPWTSLKFQISGDLFHAARARTAGSPQSFWSHVMYQRAAEDGSKEGVKVHYCATKSSMEYICKKHFLDEPVLGFDLEWLAYANRAAGPRQNVSLIQLASPSRIGLFHVARFPKDDFVAPTFQKIMEDAGVSKVGVHVQADCTRLKTFLGIKSCGIFELSHLYKLVKYIPDKQMRLINKIPVALSTQVQDHLRLPMYKDQSVRSSNWMNPLTTAQLKYSAADAYAGIQLYHVLEEKRKKLSPCPERPHHAELGLPIPIPVPQPDPNEECDEDDVLADSVSETNASSTPSKPRAPRAPRTPRAPRPPKEPKMDTRDARIIAADVKVKEYRSSKQTAVTVPPSALRSYYIWQNNDDLKPKDIAALLRDPPLQTSTVVNYILDSIAAEQLPYDKPRVKGELLKLLNAKMLKSRKYRSVVQACEDI